VYFVCAVAHFLEKFGELMAKVAGAAFRGIRFHFTGGVEEIGAMRGRNGTFYVGNRCNRSGIRIDPWFGVLVSEDWNQIIEYLKRIGTLRDLRWVEGNS
jgi:hypothetical protein